MICVCLNRISARFMFYSFSLNDVAYHSYQAIEVSHNYGNKVIKYILIFLNNAHDWVVKYILMKHKTNGKMFRLTLAKRRYVCLFYATVEKRSVVRNIFCYGVDRLTVCQQLHVNTILN